MPTCLAADVAAAVLESRTPQPEAVLEVLGQAHELDAIAWHPTGFVVAKLHVDGPLTLRLHVWPQDERRYGEPLWPAHDHVFALHSHVLLGTVHSEDYRLRDDDSGAQRRYFVEYRRGTSRSLLVADRARVVSQSLGTRTTHAGEHYMVAEGAFHASSAPEGALAATVVATLAGQRTHPAVLGPAHGPARIDVTRDTVPAARWTQMLCDVIAGYRSTLDH